MAVVDRLVYEIAAAVNRNTAEQAACQMLSGARRYYILIASKATIHMQTAVVE